MKIKDILKLSYLEQQIEIANKTGYYFGTVQNVPVWLHEYDVVYIAAGQADTDPNTIALLIDAEPPKLLDDINKEISSLIHVDNGIIQPDGSTIYTASVPEQIFKRLQEKYGTNLDETLSNNFEEYVNSMYTSLTNVAD